MLANARLAELLQQLQRGQLKSRTRRLRALNAQTPSPIGLPKVSMSSASPGAYAWHRT